MSFMMGLKLLIVMGRLRASSGNVGSNLLMDGLRRRRGGGRKDLLVFFPEVFLSADGTFEPGGENTAGELPGPGVLKLLGVGDDTTAGNDFKNLGAGVKDDVGDDTGNEAAIDHG